VLKPGFAVAVTVCRPLPAPAVKLNVHVDFAVAEELCPRSAPVTSTHLVSLDVISVRISAPPFLAYKTPPDDTAPAPPLLKVAPVTLEACAAGTLAEKPMTAAATTPAPNQRRSARLWCGNAVIGRPPRNKPWCSGVPKIRRLLRQMSHGGPPEPDELNEDFTHDLG
jgi:hypothetical protein